MYPFNCLCIHLSTHLSIHYYILSTYNYFRFQGLAIRIEDNVLITKKGADILNAGTPQTIDEITTLMN